MKQALSTPKIINGGINSIPLSRDPLLINTLIVFKGRGAGVISFRTKTLNSDFQTPGSPNSINLATNKSISFNGEPLEEIELTDAGSGDVQVTITQSQP